MNKDRRIRLAKVINILEQTLGELQRITEEEREAWDNMPDGIQNSERGAVIDNNATILEDITSTLEEDIDRLNNEIE